MAFGIIVYWTNRKSICLLISCGAIQQTSFEWSYCYDGRAHAFMQRQKVLDGVVFE